MANDMGWTPIPSDRANATVETVDTAPGRSEQVRRKTPWPAIKTLAWVFVLSRIFFIEVASLAYIYLPHAWVEAPQGTLPPPGDMLYRSLIGLWVHWDGLWYLSIATFGYQGRPTATAFFPLYPLTMRLLGAGVVSGMLVSVVAFAGALWFFYQLVRIDLGERTAWYAILGLAFFPTAFYANAVYSESLFLVLATSSLYFGRIRRYWLAGPLAALATLVTMYGILLAAPLAWLIWRQEGFRLRVLAQVLWVPAGVAAYMAYLMPLFGDPLVFERAQSNWGRHFLPPYQTLWQAARFSWRYAAQATNLQTLFALGPPSSAISNFWNFLFALVAIALLLAAARRIPFYLVLYAGLALLVPLSYPAQGNPLMSMPRLVLEAFPVFAGLGALMARWRTVRYVYFALAIPTGILFVALFATAHWVA
ncbi:MAG: mannosyltransferase family protein [Thermaerobacter sp.]|nr:mannosyltransferase family protein [Thermaerobacter sp.]